MSGRTDASIHVVDNQAICWVDAAASSECPCTVCGSTGPHRRILGVPTLSSPQRMLKLIRCASCSTAFYDPPDIRDFSDLGQRADEFWRYYVEVGGGVWETVWPLLADVRTGPRCLLDIGCGFGFALDFWKSGGKGDAEGIELADYGRRGSAMLGVTIHAERLEECAALAGRKFDIVYASEVIEHVPEPRAFVSLLSQWVADDGLLVMTTPCASFITRENGSSTLLAALAPGFHGFLLSPEAFADTARRAGFTFIDVRIYNERMVMWASRLPRAIDPDPIRGRVPYFAYMARRFGTEDPCSVIWQGYAYRYLRDLVNTGQLEQAQIVAKRLSAALIAAHGSDVLVPETIVPRLLQARDLHELGAVGPYYLPNLYYLLATIAHRVDRDAVAAKRLYAGAVAAIEASARLGPLFYLEALSLIWPARRASALMDLAAGDVDGGSQAFAHMVDDDPGNLPCGIDPPPSEFIETTLPGVAERLHSEGHAVEARRVADAYRRHVFRSYGETLLTPEGIETAIREGNVVPADPIFPLWFDALAASGAAAFDTALGGVIRLAEALANDPRFGQRFRDVARRARALTPVKPGAILYSFETTFTQPGRVR